MNTGLFDKLDCNLIDNGLYLQKTELVVKVSKLSYILGTITKISG